MCGAYRMEDASPSFPPLECGPTCRPRDRKTTTHPRPAALGLARDQRWHTQSAQSSCTQEPAHRPRRVGSSGKGQIRRQVMVKGPEPCTYPEAPKVLGGRHEGDCVSSYYFPLVINKNIMGRYFETIQNIPLLINHLPILTSVMILPKTVYSGCQLMIFSCLIILSTFIVGIILVL